MIIDNVKVYADPTLLSEEQWHNFVTDCKHKVERDGCSLTSLKVTVDQNGGFNVGWETTGQSFERIRRITGYLTGDLNSWNNAKRSEEHERVKHDVDR